MLDKVLQIPHLDLGFQFDVERMLADVEQIDEYYAYQTIYHSAQEKYAKVWSGAGLTSMDGTVDHGMTEGSSIGFVVGESTFKRTPLADKCPYLMEVLETLNCTEDRSRVMRIAPKGSLTWHSHVIHNNQDKQRLVVQIPIVVPKGFKYSVVHIKDYSKIARGHDAKTYDMTYTPGRAYLFNCFHPHNVFNPSEEYRITLMTYMDYYRNRDIIESALDKYEGPYL